MDNRIFNDKIIKSITIKWWQQAILFFIKTEYFIDSENGIVTKYKRFRGKTFLLNSFKGGVDIASPDGDKSVKANMYIQKDGKPLLVGICNDTPSISELRNEPSNPKGRIYYSPEN